MTFQVSYDTSANWATANRVPLVREWCVETDTLRSKIGDGSAAYNSLPWASIPPPAGITDGQTIVYNAATGLFTAAAFGSSEIAYAENITATATSIPINTAVDIPSCAISVAPQARPVWISASCYFTVSGAVVGLLQLQILETTSGVPANFKYGTHEMNGTPGATYEGPYGRTIYTRRRLGPTTATRTFKIAGAALADSGTPTITVSNGTVDGLRESYILAEVL